MLAKTQCKMSNLQTNEDHRDMERANFRGLVLNGMMEKKEKNTRNNPKMLRLIKCKNDNKYILNTSMSQISLHLSHLNLTTIL